jgi:hypothetical protein
MKINLGKWCVLTVLVFAARQSAALAEDGAPSDSTLREMGLSGLAMMTDDEAMEVRGEGFGSGGSSAAAWGSSFATIETPFGSAESQNAYSAKGKHEADGSNLSFAGFKITSSGGSDHHGKPPKDGNMGGDHPSKGNGGYGGKGGDKGGKSYGGKGGDKGGYGSDKGSKGHGSKGGDKGGYGSDKGSKGGYGGGKGGNKGGSPKSVSFTVFAGGSSRAHSH